MTTPKQDDLFSDSANTTKNSMQNKSLFDRMSEALKDSTNPYAQKDVLKAKNATKFIGRGSSASSTNKYRIAADDLANCGTYVKSDVVFVSAEGARNNRIAIDTKELGLAAKAGVVFITDTPADRNRPYNVGEREVEAFLTSHGYADNGQGRWSKKENSLLDLLEDVVEEVVGSIFD